MAELCQSQPIYESLLEAMPETIEMRRHLPMDASHSEKVLREYAIEVLAPASGMRIADIQCSESVLLVAIKRGGLELIPKGPLRLLPGYYVVALVIESQFIQINEEMDELTKAN